MHLLNVKDKLYPAVKYKGLAKQYKEEEQLTSWDNDEVGTANMWQEIPI